MDGASKLSVFLNTNRLINILKQDISLSSYKDKNKLFLSKSVSKITTDTTLIRKKSSSWIFVETGLSFLMHILGFYTTSTTV